LLKVIFWIKYIHNMLSDECC